MARRGGRCSRSGGDRAHPQRLRVPAAARLRRPRPRAELSSHSTKAGCPIRRAGRASIRRSPTRSAPRSGTCCRAAFRSTPRCDCSPPRRVSAPSRSRGARCDASFRLRTPQWSPPSCSARRSWRSRRACSATRRSARSSRRLRSRACSRFRADSSARAAPRRLTMLLAALAALAKSTGSRRRRRGGVRVSVAPAPGGRRRDRCARRLLGGDRARRARAALRKAALARRFTARGRERGRRGRGGRRDGAAAARCATHLGLLHVSRRRPLRPVQGCAPTWCSPFPDSSMRRSGPTARASSCRCRSAASSAPRRSARCSGSFRRWSPAIGLARILRRPPLRGAMGAPLLFAALLFAALLVQTWVVPRFSAVKASYLLSALLPASLALGVGVATRASARAQRPARRAARDRRLRHLPHLVRLVDVNRAGARRRRRCSRSSRAARRRVHRSRSWSTRTSRARARSDAHRCRSRPTHSTARTGSRLVTTAEARDVARRRAGRPRGAPERDRPCAGRVARDPESRGLRAHRERARCDAAEDVAGVGRRRDRDRRGSTRAQPHRSSRPSISCARGPTPPGESTRIEQSGVGPDNEMAAFVAHPTEAARRAIERGVRRPPMQPRAGSG